MGDEAQITLLKLENEELRADNKAKGNTITINRLITEKKACATTNTKRRK